MKFLKNDSIPAVQQDQHGRILWQADSHTAGIEGKKMVIEVADDNYEVQDMIIALGGEVIEEGDRVPAINE